ATNTTSTTDTSTLSLHDALPISSLPSAAPTVSPRLFTASTISGSGLFHCDFGCRPTSAPQPTADSTGALVKISASGPMPTSRYRSEEHTSELQSRGHLVCRLLLE